MESIAIIVHIYYRGFDELYKLVGKEQLGHQFSQPIKSVIAAIAPSEMNYKVTFILIL